ncbi:MAG: DNA translocase FtsK [Planctomycetes bacterium]|nr:DNA translocase FtsK [Planctomycetota bacterium]
MASERTKELSSLIWFGAGAFLLAAMASYSEDVLPLLGTERWHNVCGPAGFVLARALLSQLGYAAYLIPLALIGEGARLFARLPSRPLKVRVFGILLFMPVLAAALHDLLGGYSTRIPDPGGEFGIWLAGLLKHDGGLGSVGGRIALTMLLLITFVLYADLLYSRSAASVLNWLGERGGVLAFVRGGAPVGGATMLAGASAAGAALAPARSWWRRGDVALDAKNDVAPNDADDPFEGVDSIESTAELQSTADIESNEELDAELDRALAQPSRGARKQKKKNSKRLLSAVDAAMESDAVEVEYPVAEPIDEELLERRPPTPAEREVAARASALVEAKAKAEADAQAATAKAIRDAVAKSGAPATKAATAARVAVETTHHGTSDTELLEELEADRDVDAKSEVSTFAAIRPSAPARKSPPPMTHAILQTPEAPEQEPSRPYVFPSFQLLDPPERDSGGDFLKFTEEAARKLTTALRSFKVEARVVGVQRGPSITMLEVELAPGTKLTRLRALEDDLAMALAAQSVRIVAPIPNKSTAGIEIPNDARAVVRMSELLQWPGFNPQKYAIPICLGKDSSGAPRIEDLAKMPHLLVAGSTGSGKSVCLNTLIMSILFTRTPDQVKLILIDPKMVELSSFQNVPHLMCPVVTDMKRAAGILEWACEKMEERYALLHKVGVRNIYAYNKLGEDEVKLRLGDELSQDFETTLPFIVIVMDELADLMLQHGKDVEQFITRLAQKSRAVGIHVILATQRPSTNVITGLIKANLPTRIAFRVTSKIDSRVILDHNGADKLLGQGDMLYIPPGSADLSRVQGCFVTDQEIRVVVDYLAQQGPPKYSRELVQKRNSSDKDPGEIDDLFDEAAKFVVETQRGSASLLQRRFAIGYTRASRLIDLMANDGLLGEFKGSQAREVVCTSLEELEQRRAEQRKARGAKLTASVDARSGDSSGSESAVGVADADPGMSEADGDEKNGDKKNGDEKNGDEQEGKA